MRNISMFILLLVATMACNNEKNHVTENKKGLPEPQNPDDPYLTELYWSLNQSPMQERLRNLKPFPVGVVYYQQRGHNFDSVARQFKIIDSLGFTAMKQILLVAPDNPEGFEEKVYHQAIDEGISPWYYGKGGWINITQQLVDSLGIDLSVENDMPAIQAHPDMISWQKEQWHKRVDRMKNKPPKPKGMGEPGRNSPFLPERLIPYFAEWLQAEYGTMENLKEAWNEGFTETPDLNSFKEAAELMKQNRVDEFGYTWGKGQHDFRRYRDAMKFQSGLITDDYKKTMEMFSAWDPEEPERTGGHQIFENQPVNGWDLEAQAKAATVGGSFYSSIHLTHHFFLTEGEITRPVYMQARIVADMFKGGWAATWESTGGPTTWSGMHGYTVDEKLIRQLMLSYIAAGLKGIGFWSWNSRGEGWEVGEYALTNIQGNPAPRAIEAGKISKIIQDERFTIWETMDEPLVGVLYSWENEAMLGRLSLGAYPLSMPVYETDRDRQFRQYHSQAKIGISRALMNENIPYEYLTERDLEAGLAARYPVIYLPYVLALDDKHTAILKKYVENGGRLVADFPILMLDNYGRLNKHQKGSGFESLFGFQVMDYYHTHNAPKSYKGQSLNSQYGDIALTNATVLASFDDGSPAVVENRYGKGSVLVFNFEAGRAIFNPGNRPMEELVTEYTTGNYAAPFEANTKNTMVFRRSSPGVDYYIFINDGHEEKVHVVSNTAQYGDVQDVLDRDQMVFTNNSFEVVVPAYSGKWVKCLKK